MSLSIFLKIQWPISSSKVLSLVCYLLMLWSYIHLKQSFAVITEMYDDVQHYRHKYGLNGQPFTPSLIAFILSFIGSYLCSFFTFSANDFFGGIFSPFISRIYYIQAPISSFMFTYWLFFILYLDMEMSRKYTGLLNYHITKLRPFTQYTPNFQARYFIDQSINKLETNHNNLKATIGYLNWIIVANAVVSIMVLINVNVMMNETKSFDFYTICSYLDSLIIILFFIFTQASNVSMYFSENTLAKLLYKWRHSYYNYVWSQAMEAHRGSTVLIKAFGST
jgi:hypothetical protein